MNNVILKIYELFSRHRIYACMLFLLMTSGLVLSLLTLTYKEDISDFLPLDEKNQTALSVFQEISGTNKIYAIVSSRDTSQIDPLRLIAGVDTFVENVERRDTLHCVKEIVKSIDIDEVLSSRDAVYDYIPYFLTDEDYVRIDSLLSSVADYADRQVMEKKRMLMFPSSNMISSGISRDPLDLFSPILERLKPAGMSMAFETYDGYILSSDGKMAIVILESSFGNNESDNNAVLISMLHEAKSQTEESDTTLDIHIIGGPVIAVANAGQIKKDSILAVGIAVVLIVMLLIYVFRSPRNIMLIALSVGWGWLFAVGVIALYCDSVSIIVIGIASIILGIAINYPLHLIAHLKESENPRAALKEIISPLIVGNITTVGAFMCLVPLNSVALHDLGMFSSLLLVGTILFVLLFLPHIVKTRRNDSHHPRKAVIITWLSGMTLENKKWVVWGVLALTVLFGFFSFRTTFDSDMRNINYMTREQRQDLAYFQNIVNDTAGTDKLYVVSSGNTWDEALIQADNIKTAVDSVVVTGLVSRQDDIASFLVSKDMQEERLERWAMFIGRYKDVITRSLHDAAGKYNFRDNAFTPFYDILGSEYGICEFDEFKDFLSNIFVGSVVETGDRSGKKSLVQVLTVPVDKIDKVRNILSDSNADECVIFDAGSMGRSIADTLSDDFNYIGVVCGFIVFIFLWISLGRIELAIVAFLPMAFSWIWILGIMGMLGIKFNIVNVILATFIFGQGDDYTIFMVEGLSYEYAYNKKLLTSYKSSIIVSALIMFIGIGTLLFAKHPALHSLGEVTVVGMISVVLMAYLFPPLVFKWLTQKHGKLRLMPITLRTVSQLWSAKSVTCDNSTVKSLIPAVFGRYIYKGRDIESDARRALHRISAYSDVIEGETRQCLVLNKAGQGELALILAQMYPSQTVVCCMASPESKAILTGCVKDFAENIRIIDWDELESIDTSRMACYTVMSDKDKDVYTSPRNDEVVIRI